jgi:hypothetical protein
VHWTVVLDWPRHHFMMSFRGRCSFIAAEPGIGFGVRVTDSGFELSGRPGMTREWAVSRDAGRNLREDAVWISQSRFS